MTKPELSLDSVKQTATVKVSRASDFLTDEQMEEVHKSNAKGAKTNRFSVVDAYIAEIIARFGYDTYVAWKFGEISEDNMLHFIQAERAREAQHRLMIENIIVASVSGANHPTKSGHAPKSLTTAIKMLKTEQKLAEGGK